MPAVDVGDLVPLTVVVRDDAGDPADADDVTCTVTLPDGATASPAVAKTATGTYQALLTATQEGPHGWRMVATGTNACAFHDGFTVRAHGVPLLGLADVKEWLNKDLGVHVSDEELRTTIDAATSVAEGYCGRALRPRTWTGTITANRLGVLVLPEPAATSVTAVLDPSGTPTAGWELDGTGQVIAADLPMSGQYAVTARLGVAGAALDIAQQGVRELVRHMWSPQRGGAPLPMGGAADMARPGSAHALPYIVTEKLDQIVLDF